MKWWIVRRKVHVSWLIAYFSVGIVCGVIGVQYVQLHALPWLFVGGALGVLCLWMRRMYIVPIICVAGSIVGLWRGSVTLEQVQPFRSNVGKIVTITGVVTEDTDVGKGNETVLRIRSKTVDGHTLSGMIWASIQTNDTIKRSDTITIKGKLSDGFGGFAASIYRGEIMRLQRAEPGDVALKVRDSFAEFIRRAIPEPQASLGIGYLVGQHRALPANLDDALRTAGLTHVIVASGYNLTILVRLARRLFMRISKFTSLVAAGGLIVAFIGITGMSPSMSRAGLVAGLSLLAWYYGRTFHPLVLLPFAAAITLLINPSYGWNDLGWQLSFASFAGVMLVAPLLQRYFFGNKEPGVIRQVIGETMSAQLCTLPLILIAFGQMSNVALIANVLILPLIPVTMLLTFVAGVVAWLLPDIAVLAGWPARLLLEYMTTTAQWLAQLPWAQTEITLSWPIAVVGYGIVVTCCLYMWRKTRLNMREVSVVE